MKYIYEFIGTFFLVLTIGMTVLDPLSIGNFAPLAIGSALAVMVYAGGHISGAHYNPAVSFAVFLRGKLTLNNLASYWVAQLVGALLAGLTVLYLKGNGALEAYRTIDNSKLFLAEFLFTFALCYVVLNVATAKETEGNSFFGFAIGFTVLAGAYAVGSVSGGAFNPAVVLGAIVMKITHLSHLWIYIIANLLGAAVAALTFKAAHKSDLNH